MTDQILSGLTIRRAQLVAEAQKADAALLVMLADIEHMDAAIRQFDPSYRAPSVRLPRETKRGALTKSLLTMLRLSPKGMTAREMASRVMLSRNMNIADAKLATKVVVRVRIAMICQRKHGIVMCEVGPDQMQVWRVAG